MPSKVNKAKHTMKSKIALLLLGLLVFQSVQAQYFGRNKPRYQKLDYKVENTANFTMYHHLERPEKVKELAQWTEQWYAMHQAILKDTFLQRNPIIFYNDHSGFQQTNAIQGDISVGTGGVTEGLRNRVVMPIAPTNQQTYHVLGHELVHAFQYNMVINGDTTSLRNLANVPLWMVEGLAEYMSIGRIDAHTALWIRDAIQHDYLPTVRDLSNMGKYFPYRWGQAFWAYVAGTYGDAVIPELYMMTARAGLEYALIEVLKTDAETLSENWKTALKQQFAGAVTPKMKEDIPGKRLFEKGNQGKMTVSPSVSPNGKYVVYLTEKNLFTTDLYLADAKTGKVIRRLSSTATDGHIDQMNFIESAGAWSPDSKQYAFDVYEKGRSTLIIKDIERAKTVRKIKVKGVPAFSNPTWSPDGKTIVVSGLVQGQPDLFSIDVKTGKATQLTNDRYSEIHPTWSADGSLLAFATDRLSMQRGRTNGAWKMNLALMDMVSNRTEDIDVFPGADNMNPQFTKDGDLYFLSDRDGKRNLYRLKLKDKRIFQMTDLVSGITGITFYAPALSIAEDRDRIIYTHYSERAYVIYTARAEQFLNKEITDQRVDFTYATLPPAQPAQEDIVNQQLRQLDAQAKIFDTVTTTRINYKPHFILEYLGGSAGIGGGIATGNSSFGNATAMAGGIDMLFGDILGNNQLYSGIAIGGDILDAAGQFSYINQKHRINWGANLSHVPITSGRFLQDNSLGVITNLDGDTLTSNGKPVLGYTDQVFLDRVFQEQLNLFTFYPLSVTKRLELGSAINFYHNRVDEYRYYVDQFERQLGTERRKIGSDPAIGLSNLNAAFVGDNSYFGFTAPLDGWRFRVGMEQFFGAYKFNALLLDGRRYFKFKPITFAVRGLSYLRMGGNANNINEVYPLFAGQQFLVRGYTQRVLQSAPELVNQMSGSKIAIANAELRLPFFGIRPLSLINVPFLPTDLNWFFDAGVGFFKLDDLKPNETFPSLQHKPLYSTGLSIRINLFNALILEPYYSWALRLPDGVTRRGQWGFNIVPGW